MLKKIFKSIGIALFVIFSAFTLWQASKTPPTQADWKDTLKVLSTAEFHDNLVTVKNVRNFQYDVNGQPTVEAYYDKTYDLSKLKKVWYITEPFNSGSPFAHTFLSFEFSDGAFLAITIEGRLTKSESYSAINGTLRTFPLMYIAADERDAVYIRANILKAPVYVYPLKANQKDGQLLLLSLLNRMNDLSIHPAWYNTISANCTSSIAKHVNQIWSGMLPSFDWQVIITGYADKMALERGFLDTNLNIEQARNKFYITDVADKVGYTENYSKLIRQ